MRVGFLTSICGWGGSEVYLGALIRGVGEQGHIPVLFGIHGARLTAEMEAAGVEIRSWSTRGQDACDAAEDGAPPGCRPGVDVRRWVPRSVRLWTGAWRDACQLKTVLRQAAVDVLHVNVHGYEVAPLACRALGLPCVGMYLTTPIRDPWRSRRLLMRHTARQYDAVCAQSRACLALWQAWAGLPARGQRLAAIHNGVDLATFAAVPDLPRTRGVDQFELLFVGRLHPMKGCGVLLRAMDTLRDLSLRLTLLGDGPEREKLEQVTQDLGLAKRVRFIGHTEAVASALAEADAVVLPSVALESGPRAVAEAMAAGRPVITSDFGPLPEMNVDGLTGLVVPAGDPVQLSAAIRRLALDPAGCLRMGKAARARAATEFSDTAMVRQTIDLYTAVLKQPMPG